MSQLTHINAAGEAHMVDVSAKAETVREARAEAFVTMRSETLAMIIDGSHHKGDVFATARIAGIQAAKRTWELIPLCHPLLLSKVEVQLQAEPEHNRVRIESLCRLTGKSRRGDGSADSRFRGGIDDLRHVQSSAKRYGDWPGALAGEKRR